MEVLPHLPNSSRITCWRRGVCAGMMLCQRATWGLIVKAQLSYYRLLECVGGIIGMHINPGALKVLTYCLPIVYPAQGIQHAGFVCLQSRAGTGVEQYCERL